jgi:N-acetylglucosaminyldiphosphoundecaprenol N-acetyl-beta-D-mannosaminyltransferase
MDREAGPRLSGQLDARTGASPAGEAPAWARARVDVLGVGVSAIDMDQAVAEIGRWVTEREQHYVCVTGVHGVMESQRDPDLRHIHNASGLTTPDGMPMVWAGHRAGATHMRRVYGPDLMLELCALAAERGWSSFFYGGAEGVPEQLAERLAARFPGLRVAGCWSPPFRPLTPEEDDEVVRRINEAAPDLVWVGLSTPKQERWMAAHAGRLHASALLGVGAAFDMHAGRLPQAPPWMQHSGLEWLYRLVREPRRLWRRYLVNNPRFVLAIARRPPALVVDLSERAPPARTNEPASTGGSGGLRPDLSIDGEERTRRSAGDAR